MGDTDSQLVAACQAGDMGALKALYDRYVDRVWRLGYLRTRSRDVAEDVVQETFLRVARSIARFEGRSSFGTYLFAVARSVAIDAQRRGCREQSVGDEPAVLKLVSAEEADSADESTREAVRAALSRLPEAQHDALVLFELSDLSVRECGEVLGWRASRVKVTLFRARRALREMLADGGFGQRMVDRKRDAGGAS